jgi:hypothetical protein
MPPGNWQWTSIYPRDDIWNRPTSSCCCWALTDGSSGRNSHNRLRRLGKPAKNLIRNSVAVRAGPVGWKGRTGRRFYSRCHEVEWPFGFGSCCCCYSRDKGVRMAVSATEQDELGGFVDFETGFANFNWFEQLDYVETKLTKQLFIVSVCLLRLF